MKLFKKILPFALVTGLAIGTLSAYAAWDDTKQDGDSFVAAEYNELVRYVKQWIFTPGGDTVLADANGKVGIGTASPMVELDVHGSIHGTTEVRGGQLCIGDDCRAEWPSGTGGDNLGNHVATQDLDMSNQKITGLAAPTDDADATNKAYVDQQVAAAGGGSLRWEGTTEPFYGVIMENLGESDQKCRDLYPGSHFASYEEIMKVRGDLPSDQAFWVHDAIQSTYDYQYAYAYASESTYMNQYFQSGDYIYGSGSGYSPTTNKKQSIPSFNNNNPKNTAKSIKHILKDGSSINAYSTIGGSDAYDQTLDCRNYVGDGTYQGNSYDDFLSYLSDLSAVERVQLLEGNDIYHLDYGVAYSTYSSDDFTHSFGLEKNHCRTPLPLPCVSGN